ncbi:MAG: class I SAM-dependent methyltransferase [Candidatus Pacebacteria bacterium]|nr:class I SAM-dependent methyltransferase [Candidatus Paceibacterota bacterium]
MIIKQYFNITEEEIKLKSRNIFVPICLGNKFFVVNNQVTDNLAEYIKWALDHTKERVLVFIVDKIQDTNYLVRNKVGNLTYSRKRVIEDGQLIKKSVTKLIKEKFLDQKNKIEVITYKEYEKLDLYCLSSTVEAYKEFKNNYDFQRAVIETVKLTVRDRNFSEYEYLRLGDYILDEFSLVYSGLAFKNIFYNLFIYPKTDATVYFIENIQKGNFFQKLAQRLPQETTGLAILNQEKEFIDVGKYYGSFAEKYEEIIKSPEVDEKIHKNLMKIFKKHGILKGTILDIGCGPGNLKTSLNKEGKTGFLYSGIDISQKMLEKAKSKGYKKVIHGYIEEMIRLIPSNSFDYVVGISSLHFVDDINTVLKHFQRIARKGIIFSLDKITDNYKEKFKSVCVSPVYNHYNLDFPNSTEDISFKGWTSPRDQEPITVRLIYKKIVAENK